MTASLQDASGFYVWTYPGCPIRVLLALEVVERLRAEILEGPSDKIEHGGLLIAKKRTEPHTVQIVDFVPLPEQPDPSDPHFRLDSQWMAEVIARCPSDARVAGYFRTDLEQNIRLRADDLETIPSNFRDTSGVFLVIALNGPEANAGFFVRDRGVVAANPTLTFPLSMARLISEGWPRVAEQTHWKTELRYRVTQLGERIAGINVLIKIAALSGALAFLGGVLVLRWNGVVNATRAPAPRVGLQVKREGAQFLISWDQTAREVASAQDAGLLIWDETKVTGDGSNQPLLLPLTPVQLRSGNVTYTSVAPSDKIKFQLETTGPSGTAVSEPAAVPPPPAPPAVEAASGRLGKPKQLARDLAARETEQPPAAARSARPGKKTFVPPKSRFADAPREAEMLEPPRLRTPSRLSAQATSPVAPAAPRQSDVTPTTLDKLPSEGLVNITSEPSGAQVEINAVPAGTTPVTLQVTPVGLGFTVTLTKDGFQKWSVQTFSTAQPYALHVKLTPAR